MELGKKLHVGKSSTRNKFDSSNESDDGYRKALAMSDTDLMTKESKRNGLIDMFLKGTEVDNYIINNMYGRKKYKDNNDESFGEMTLLDNLNPDETFTN
jgi:hypothetical protein